MSESKFDVFINASPEACFTVFSDLDEMAERVTALMKLEKLSEGPMALGTKWRETRKMFGQESSEVMTISEFDSPKFYAATAASHGAEYYSRYDFAPEADGTRVTMTFRSEAISLMAKIMAIFSGAMMKSIQKAVAADMDELKSYIEASKQLSDS